MSDTTNETRRRLLRGSVGAAAMVASAPLVAATTPGQSEGPFYPVHEQRDTDADMTHIEGHDERAVGEIVEVSGRVLDEDGNPVADALVDVWQANSHGRYAHERDRNPAPLDENFQGWAKLQTDAEGRYRFRTIRPGAYPVREDWSRPPHIHFKVAHQDGGEVTTQMYFEGDPLIEDDIVMRGTPAELRHLLITSAVEDPETGLPLHRFDIALG